MKLALAIHPILGLITVLIAPNFMAGLMHGAQAVASGQRLRLGYLSSGFLKSGGALVTIGGVSLLGQVISAMLIFALAGDEMKQLAAVGPLADPANVEQVRALSPQIVAAFAVGTALSVPFLLASWFSPLLVFFDDMKPLPAMLLSLRACLRNFGAFF